MFKLPIGFLNSLHGYLKGGGLCCDYIRVSALVSGHISWALVAAFPLNTARCVCLLQAVSMKWMRLVGAFSSEPWRVHGGGVLLVMALEGNEAKTQQNTCGASSEGLGCCVTLSSALTSFFDFFWYTFFSYIFIYNENQ